ncbi:pilus assembly protein PilM [Paenibacillus sp. M1]|uniref:Pilus assembly protein PilM n=1 Tax=Paenibacillus haidiansis TaxID=1574488 RepID=A0ABU7VRF4_9BACL
MVSVKSDTSLKKKRAARKAIGITVDEDGLRFIRYNPKRGAVEQAGMISLGPVMDDDGVPDLSRHGEELSSWVRQHGLSGSKVHLAAPTSQSFIRLIRVPKVKRKHLRRVTDLEVESSIRFPFEDPIIDYHWIEDESGPEGTMQAFVAAVPRPMVTEMISALNGAGLKIVSVDLETNALMRVMSGSDMLAKGNVMAINFKPKEAEVYLYHRGVPDFVRTFPLETMFEDNLNTWRYGEIVSSVTRIMNFYENTLHEGTERIQDIVITGNAPDKSVILQRLKETFEGLSVSEIDLSPYFADVSVDNRDSYAVALGLALKGGA